MNPKAANTDSSGLTAALIIVLCLVAVWHFVLPALGGSKKSKVVAVVSNLKQIELMKEMWPSEANSTSSAAASRPSP